MKNLSLLLLFTASITVPAVVCSSYDTPYDSLYDDTYDPYDYRYEDHEYPYYEEEAIEEIPHEELEWQEEPQEIVYPIEQPLEDTHTLQWQIFEALFNTIQDPSELYCICKEQVINLIYRKITLQGVVNESGENLLHWAARGGPAGNSTGCKLALVRYLATGISPEDSEITKEHILHHNLVATLDNEGNLPIHAALPPTLENQEEIKELLNLLLQNREDLVNWCNNNGESPLEKAYILARAEDGEDITSFTVFKTMLDMVQGERPKVLKKGDISIHLSSDGQEPVQINDENSELLAYYAIREGRIDLLTMILECTTSDIPQELLAQPYIHCAAACASIEGLKSLEYILNAQPATLNQVNSDGLTPVYIAARANNKAAMKVLMAKSGTIGNKARELVHELCQRNYYKALNKLLKSMSQEEKNTYTKQKRSIQSSPLYSAITNCSLESVKILINHKTHYNVHSFFESPLHVAGKTLKNVRDELDRVRLYKIMEILQEDAPRLFLALNNTP